MGVLFKKGYNAVREEKQRQDEAREKSGMNIWRFFLANDGDEADVVFLNEEPITFEEHTIKVFRNGKERYDSHICVGENCKHCAEGNKPSFKGAYLIWDMRHFEYTDTQGNKKSGEGQLRLYVQGARVLSQLDRISARYGLANRVITIARLGKGTNTTYIIERGEDSKFKPFTSHDIMNLLPEKLREFYNHTAEGLYEVLQQVLTTSIEEDTDTPSEDTPSKDTATQAEYDNRKNLVGVDSEPEPPKEVKKAPLMFKKKPSENSVKSILRKK